MTSPAPRGHRNRLAAETSPYLLQHAGNPVDWHPWGPEALELARSRGQADPAVDRLFGLSLVPRDGARVVRGRGDRRAHERAVRQHQGGPRGTPRPRPHLPDRAPGAERSGRRLAADDVPVAADAPAVLRRHVFPAGAASTACRRFRDVLRAGGRFLPRSTATTSREHGDKLVEVLGQLQPPPAAARRRARRASRSLHGARDAAARIRRQLRRLRRGAQVPAPDEPRVPAAHLARDGRRRRAGPAGALHGDADAHAHGRGRPVRPARRRLLPLFGRPVLDDPALREDAVRQRAAARACTRRLPSPPANRCSAASPPKRPTGCCATCAHPRAASIRRSMPIPRATRAGSTSGRPTRCATLLDVEQYEPFAQRFGLDRDANFEGQWHLHTFKSIADIADGTAARRGHRRGPHRRSARASCSRCAMRASGRAATRRSSPPGTAWRSADWRAPAAHSSATTWPMPPCRPCASCANAAGKMADCWRCTRTASPASRPTSTTTRCSRGACSSCCEARWMPMPSPGRSNSST